MASSSDVRSAVSSPRTSQPPSLKSSESPGQSPRLAPQNGLSVPPTSDQLGKVPERASVKDRLTRMFSAKDASQRAPSEGAAAQQAKKSPADSRTVTPVHSHTVPPPKPSASPRKGSSDKSTEKVPPATATKPKTNGKEVHALRFDPKASVPGGHEHHLKTSHRQEKLTNMFKTLLGGKKTEQAAPEHDLSLVSSWVDTLKKEKEGFAPDKRGGPNATVTLVQKYGKCQEVVGRGAFGIVRISHKKLDNGVGEKLFAVKEFRRRPEETEKKYSKRLTAEFCISSSLRHPNVIHTLDLLQDAKGDYCEVMEFCAGGDLYTLVLAAGKLEVQESDCFFKQMMRGVEYMHEMGVAHRDLKPENLLLTTHGGLKITDFGNGECFRMAWENDAHMVSGLCGSAPYIAPEEYVDREFDARAVDVWACGVIYMAMRTGRHLWRVAKKDEDEFYAKYLEGRRDEEGYHPIESLHRVRLSRTKLASCLAFFF